MHARRSFTDCLRSLFIAAVAGATAGLATPATAAGTGKDQADAWHARGREMLAHAISIPTVIHRGKVQELIAYLRGQFEAAGITDVKVHNYDDTSLMIVRWPAVGKPKAKPLLLLGHLDVVEAKREDWSRDPFEFAEQDGYFYGRGTTDMKDGVVAIANALLRLKAEGFKPSRDLIVLYTGDEETLGHGASLAATQWRAETDAEFALNADAGGGAKTADGHWLGFGLQTSEKMFQDFTFTVHNPGGHSSRPRPDNAIYELASALKRLEAHRFTPELNETTRAYFSVRQKQEGGALGEAMRRWLANPEDSAAADAIEADPLEVGKTRTRCVATMLKGGHADNALAQLAEANVNCRIMPGVPAEAILKELQQVAGAGVEVTAVAPSHPSPPSPLRPDVVKAYTDAVHKRHPGVDILADMSTGATDGSFFRATGMPVYGVTGAWIVSPIDERAHGRDERLPVAAFYDNLDHWRELITTLAR